MENRRLVVDAKVRGTGVYVIWICRGVPSQSGCAGRRSADCALDWGILLLSELGPWVDLARMQHVHGEPCSLMRYDCAFLEFHLWFVMLRPCVCGGRVSA